MAKVAGSKTSETLPSITQWAELYEAAGVIKALMPWETLWDTDLITLVLPGREEPVFCSIMGRNGECFGIGVYPGYESIRGYYRLIGAKKSEPPYVLMSYQNCLTCYYGDREEVAPQDREIMDQLGLKFRGRNNWVYFRTMKTGYYPWFLDAEQVDLMTQALQNLAMAYTHLKSGNLTVNFEDNETLLRFYSSEKGEWLNGASQMPAIPYNGVKYTIRDEDLIKTLNLNVKTEAKLEFDLIYLPKPIQENRLEVPWLPKIALLVDRESGFIVDQRMLAKDEENEDIIILMLKKFIENYGRPTAIYVRNDLFGNYIEDLCRKIEVEFFTGKRMRFINKIANELNNVMG